MTLPRYDTERYPGYAAEAADYYRREAAGFPERKEAAEKATAHDVAIAKAIDSGTQVGEFIVKDSGKREDFPSGMRRDTEEGKYDYTLVFDGPLVDRVAAHLTKGAEKYGRRNWQLACSLEEAERFQRSAARHFRQWLRGDQDEDHFAAVVFNMNAHEDVLARLPQS